MHAQQITREIENALLTTSKQQKEEMTKKT